MSFYTTQRPLVVLLGDSITEYGTKIEGLHSLLLNWLSVRADILNRGCSGWNTEIMLRALKQDFDKAFSSDFNGRQVLIVICLGANDACSKDSPTKQHVPQEMYRENIIQLVDLLRNRFATANQLDILLSTPPPVHDDFYVEIWKDSSRSNAVASQYAERVRDVVNHFSVSNVSLVDLWKKAPQDNEPCLLSEVKSVWPREFFTDGLHLSGQGYSNMFQHIKCAIKKNVSQLDGDSMAFSHTYWRDAVSLVQPEQN